MADTTKEGFASRLAYLVGEFGEASAAVYKGVEYPWSYVARIQSFLDEALSVFDPAAPAALILRQRPNCVAATMALWAQGRCATLLSPLAPDRAIVEDIARLQPGIVIADVEDWSRPGLSDACGGAFGIELRADRESPIAFHRSARSALGAETRVPTSYAAQIVTSGTTGSPKRYAIAWSDLSLGMSVRDPSPERGVMINVLPLFSIGGTRAIATSLFSGRPMALMDKLDVVEWAGLIRDYAPRRAGAPPAVLRMVLDAEIPPDWLSSVKTIYTASAPLSMQLADEFERVYGIPIVQGYGATEFLGAVTGWADGLYEKWGQVKRGSVGKTIPGVKVRVVDSATRSVVGPNEIGNLEVDSPYRVQGVPSGWVPTNDLARIDEDEFVWVLGRSDDVIIRGGFKVHLPEIEACLLDHPHVSDVCVVGLPDDRLGEVPAALVVTDPSDPPTEAELIDVVRQRLAPYMAPVLIARYGEMPLNAMFKKDRLRVTSLLQAQLASRTQGAG